jgi:hypothetical protein
MHWILEQWIEENLPEKKKEYSRDAVEILLKQVWDKAKGVEQSDAKEREREARYGPMFY